MTSSNTNQDLDIKPSLPWWVAAATIASTIFVQAAAYVLLSWNFDSIAERGQFGDAFGVVNALFSGLGFAGLVVALVLQQKQIRWQQIESLNMRREAAAALASQVTSNGLAALTFLLDHYERATRAGIGSNVDGPAGASWARSKADIEKKKLELTAILAQLHADVVSILGGDNVR